MDVRAFGCARDSVSLRPVAALEPEPLPATGSGFPPALSLSGFATLVCGAMLVVARRHRGEPRPALRL